MDLMKSILVVNGRDVCLPTGLTAQGWTNWSASKPIFETAKLRSNVSHMHNSTLGKFLTGLAAGLRRTHQQQARRCPGARGPQRTGCAVRDTRRT